MDQWDAMRTASAKGFAVPDGQNTLTLRKNKPPIRISILRTRGGETEVAPDQPHWIVMRLSEKHESPVEFGLRFYFRHGSEERAILCAQKLAKNGNGRRFAVYASGPTFKVARREHDR